eukprot:7196997-Pyramimonas_sp.AAC.1
MARTRLSLGGGLPENAPPPKTPARSARQPGGTVRRGCGKVYQHRLASPGCRNPLGKIRVGKGEPPHFLRRPPGGYQALPRSLGYERAGENVTRIFGTMSAPKSTETGVPEG